MSTAKDIRDLRQQDLSSLLKLYAHLHVDDAPLPDPAELAASWAELLTLPRCRVLGGFVGEALVASCTVLVVPNLTRGARPFALIENVVTHAACRGQGWGHALLREATDHAWAQRCYKAMLMTGRKDEATLRFYELAGFDRQGKQAFVARPPSR